jgi:hypothetical protein
MNSNKVIVSGKNATTSVFINCSQSQKEEAERLEYEIRNSCTSTEEDTENEEDNVSDDESDDDYSDYDSDEGEPEEKSSYIVGQKQKPRVEKKSWYRVKKEAEEESDFENEHDEMKHLKVVEVLKNERDELKEKLKKAEQKIFETCDYEYILEENQRVISQNKSLKETIRGLHVSLSKMTKQYNKKTLELKDEKIFRRDNEDNFFRLLDEHRRLEKVMKNVTI